MVDSCATCFFARNPPTDSGLDPSLITCNNKAPDAKAKTDNWPWPIVNPDFWCGSGADLATGASFSASVNSLPGPGASAGHSVYSGPVTPPAFPATDGDLYFYYNVGTLQEIWAMNMTWTLIANHFPP